MGIGMNFLTLNAHGMFIFSSDVCWMIFSFRVRCFFSGSLNVNVNVIFVTVLYCSRMHEIVLHKYADRIPFSKITYPSLKVKWSTPDGHDIERCHIWRYLEIDVAEMKKLTSFSIQSNYIN